MLGQRRKICSWRLQLTNVHKILENPSFEGRKVQPLLEILLVLTCWFVWTNKWRAHLWVGWRCKHITLPEGVVAGEVGGAGAVEAVWQEGGRLAGWRVVWQEVPVVVSVGVTTVVEVIYAPTCEAMVINVNCKVHFYYEILQTHKNSRYHNSVPSYSVPFQGVATAILTKPTLLKEIILLHNPRTWSYIN